MLNKINILCPYMLIIVCMALDTASASVECPPGDFCESAELINLSNALQTVSALPSLENCYNWQTTTSHVDGTSSWKSQCCVSPPEGGPEVDQPVAVAPTPDTPQKQKNFAAEKDGAKVVANNKQAKKVSALLDDDLDTYMRNDCLDDKWVVIELSQVVKVNRIMLDQYELYSSRVKQFEVFGRLSNPMVNAVEQYKDLNDSQWKPLGTFKADKMKGTQTFSIESPAWVRYVLLHFLQHYGSERVCALNGVAVIGKSAAEELEDQLASDDTLEEDQSQNQVQSDVGTGIQGGNNEQPPPPPFTGNSDSDSDKGTGVPPPVPPHTNTNSNTTSTGDVVPSNGNVPSSTGHVSDATGGESSSGPAVPGSVLAGSGDPQTDSNKQQQQQQQQQQPNTAHGDNDTGGSSSSFDSKEPDGAAPPASSSSPAPPPSSASSEVPPGSTGTPAEPSPPSPSNTTSTSTSSDSSSSSDDVQAQQAKQDSLSDLVDDLMPRSKSGSSIYEILVQEIRSTKAQQKLMHKTVEGLQRNLSSLLAAVAAQTHEEALRPRVAAIVDSELLALKDQIVKLQQISTKSALREHAAVLLFMTMAALHLVQSPRLSGYLPRGKRLVVGLAVANGCVGLLLHFTEVKGYK